MIEQGSKEWFEQRKGRITASNVGAILGLDPYRDADDVLRQMVRDSLGAEPEFTGNVATEWGSYNEEGAIAELEMRTGLKTEKCGFYPYEDWLGASPDRLVGKHDILECKCPYGLRNDEKPNFKSIKDQPHYYAQIQIQLYCTDSNKCHFYQWTPQDIKREDVCYNHDWINDVLPILKSFHEKYLYELQNNAAEYLKPKRSIIDTPKAHAMIEEWDDIKEQLELLEERKKDLLAEIVSMAKDHDADFAGRKLTKVNKSGSIAYAKIVKEHLPKLDLEPYTGKASSFWKIT